MKRITIFFASLAALSLSLTSCLDETPKDQLPEQNIYDSANSLYVNAVASLYNYIGAHEESEGLQGTCRGIYDYNTLTLVLSLAACGGKKTDETTAPAEETTAQTETTAQKRKQAAPNSMVSIIKWIIIAIIGLNILNGLVSSLF